MKSAWFEICFSCSCVIMYNFRPPQTQVGKKKKTEFVPLFPKCLLPSLLSRTLVCQCDYAACALSETCGCVLLQGEGELVRGGKSHFVLS